MIKITYSTRTSYVAPSHIERIEVAGTSSQYQGIRCYVYLHSGTVLECNEPVDSVLAMLEKESK